VVSEETTRSGLSTRMVARALKKVADFEGECDHEVVEVVGGVGVRIAVRVAGFGEFEAEVEGQVEDVPEGCRNGGHEETPMVRL
jgi:hypothetical protein